jgi:pyrimidine-nucleoside phosphorylase
MSKKIAGGANAILLDVKVGYGAFMRTLEEARQLAELMVGIARLAGRRAIALLSDMNQPLGWAVGNALEVGEAIDTLHGGGPEDFREHCLEAAAYLLVLGKKVETVAQGRTLAEKALGDGRAWERFRTLVVTQGGDVAYVDEPQRFPRAALVESLPAPRSGYLEEINARVVGETSVMLGAGREKKTDPIDHAVGIEILHKVGDWVEAGQPLCVVHANQTAHLAEARQRLLQAHQWSDTPVEPLPLFYGVIE